MLGGAMDFAKYMPQIMAVSQKLGKITAEGASDAGLVKVKLGRQSDFGTKVTELKVDPSLLQKTPAEVERHVMQAINQGLAKEMEELKKLLSAEMQNFKEDK